MYNRVHVCTYKLVFNCHLCDKGKMIAYLGSADPDCQFQSIMIHIILLPEDNFFENSVFEMIDG